MILSRAIIFCGNSTDSKIVFYIQKKVIGILAGSQRRALSREMSMKCSSISQCMLAVIIISYSRQHRFQANLDNHNISTRYRYNQILFSINIKRAFCTGIMLFGKLSPHYKKPESLYSSSQH